MATTVVTRNYQITLPKEIREMEDIQVGDKLFVSFSKDTIELRKLSRERLKAVFGAWKTTEDSVKTIRKLRDQSEQRTKRLGL